MFKLTAIALRTSDLNSLVYVLQTETLLHVISKKGSTL